MTTQNNYPGVLVIGDHIQALGIVRSLGQMKVPVYVLDYKQLSIVRFSRYVTKFIKTPSLSDSQSYLDFLLSLVSKYELKNFIIIPTNDYAVEFLSRNKEILEQHYYIPTPKWEITKYAVDKQLTYKTAKKLNIDTPESILLSDISDSTYKNIKFPVFVKGVEGLKFYKKTGHKAFSASNVKEFGQILKTISSKVNPSEVIIQEFIPGDTSSVYSFCSFFKDGKIVAFWTGRKKREHPMGSGTATLAESISAPDIIEPSKKFLKYINYYGISEIEFKKDSRDGKFKMIEMNARSWLWVSLARRAGVDFVAMLYSDMQNKPYTGNHTFKENILWIHIYTDIWMSLKEILGHRLKLKDYIISLSPEKEFAVFSYSDPLPFIAETFLLPYLWWKR
jgi:predicted ATP-grasp superfamily ATP-dependent carboligase